MKKKLKVEEKKVEEKNHQANQFHYSAKTTIFQQLSSPNFRIYHRPINEKEFQIQQAMNQHQQYKFHLLYLRLRQSINLLAEMVNLMMCYMKTK